MQKMDVHSQPDEQRQRKQQHLLSGSLSETDTVGRRPHQQQQQQYSVQAHEDDTRRDESEPSNNNSDKSHEISNVNSRTDSSVLGSDSQADNIILGQMARSGVPLHPWSEVVRPLLMRSITSCLDEFRQRRHPDKDWTLIDEEEFVQRKREVIDLLNNFYSAPFTLQRICEIVLNPEAHYKTIQALLKGFEVLLSVSSTVPVASPEDVARLQREYERVISYALPGSSTGTPLRRTDTVEMEVE